MSTRVALDFGSGKSLYVPLRELEEAQAEIERLGRCNEQLSRSHAEAINHQNAEIKRLKEENNRTRHILSCIPAKAVIAAKEAAGYGVAIKPM